MDGGFSPKKTCSKYGGKRGCVSFLYFLLQMMTRHCKRCKSFQHAFLVVTSSYATNGPKKCTHLAPSSQQVLYRRRHDLFVLSLFHLVIHSGHAPRPFLFVWFWRENGFFFSPPIGEIDVWGNEAFV